MYTIGDDVVNLVRPRDGPFAVGLFVLERIDTIEKDRMGRLSLRLAGKIREIGAARRGDEERPQDKKTNPIDSA